MEKDTLFLLRPVDSPDDAYYCPDCAFIEGVLAYYPFLRNLLDIRYVDFPRPRPAIVAEIGDEHQDSPVLIISEDRTIPNLKVEIKMARGRYFINDPRGIAAYLAEMYGVGRPH